MTYHSQKMKGKHGGQRGFTLVEVMISMTIFTVLVTIGIGAILDAIQQHHVTENTRVVMDNLNFVMEDMARNIRLGENIHCAASTGETMPAFVTPTDPVVPESCPLPTNAHNLVWFNDQNGDHVAYYISPGNPPTDPNSHIYKVKGDSFSDMQLVSPPEIAINYAESGFTVRGAEPGDGTQPTVLIRLVGTATYKGINSNFSIETTVTLRGLDS